MSLVKPIDKSIKAKGHTPQYRMHRYFARRPYNVFRGLISHYSKKGDIVLDCFCGGGVTVFEGAALERKVVGVDINPLATFITRMQMFNGDITALERLYEEFSLSELSWGIRMSLHVLREKIYADHTSCSMSHLRKMANHKRNRILGISVTDILFA